MRAYGFATPALRYDFGSGPSLRSETAWFPRSRTPLATRCPSATIRQDHSLSQAPVATSAALPRSHLRRLLPPLTACRLHFAPAPTRRICPLEALGIDVSYLGFAFHAGYAQMPLGLRCSLSLRRSRLSRCTRFVSRAGSIWRTARFISGVPTRPVGIRCVMICRASPMGVQHDQ